MPDDIELDPKSDRELLIIAVQRLNDITGTHLPDIVRRLDRGQVRMDQSDKRTGKLELWQAGMMEWKKRLNGNGTVGMSRRAKAAVGSGIATLILVAIDAGVRLLSKS